MTSLAKMKISQSVVSASSISILLLALVVTLGVVRHCQSSQMQDEMCESEVVPMKLPGTTDWNPGHHFRRLYPCIPKTAEKSRAEALDFKMKSAAETDTALEFGRSPAARPEQEQLVDQLLVQAGGALSLGQPVSFLPTCQIGETRSPSAIHAAGRQGRPAVRPDFFRSVTCPNSP